MRGRIASGFLGESAINQEKLEEEGAWCQQHVILGVDFNAHPMSISLPEPEMVGAEIPIEGIPQWKGALVMLVKSAHQVRGFTERFRTADPVWPALSDPVGELLTYGDGDNESISPLTQKYGRPLGIRRRSLKLV